MSGDAFPENIIFEELPTDLAGNIKQNSLSDVSPLFAALHFWNELPLCRNKMLWGQTSLFPQKFDF